MMAECQARPVTTNQPFRKLQNRYRLACGYSIDCGCIHRIGSLVYCLTHGRMEIVTWSAIIGSGNNVST
jgi:hypothetical protein